MMSTYRKQLGVTLIELMVSIVIALIVLGGAIGVVITSRESFVNEQEASFMQENARFAIELMTRDIRMAGSKGCAPNVGSWRVTGMTEASGLFGDSGIEGFESVSSLASPPTWLGGASGDSDAVVIRYADPDGAISITNHIGIGADTFSTLADTSNFDVGDKLMVVDSSCRHYALFEATAVSATQITRSISGSNCDTSLFSQDGDPKHCSEPASSPPSRFYRPGSTLFPYRTSGYFIGDSNVISGVPALKRQVFTSSGMRSEEMAQGIESLELLYGVDEDAGVGDELEIDVFLQADDVSDWDDVLAVKMTFILRSQAEFFDTNTAVTLNGEDYNDKYLRQLVSSTVNIRSRG